MHTTSYTHTDSPFSYHAVSALLVFNPSWVILSDTTNSLFWLMWLNLLPLILAKCWRNPVEQCLPTHFNFFHLSVFINVSHSCPWRSLHILCSLRIGFANSWCCIWICRIPAGQGSELRQSPKPTAHQWPEHTVLHTGQVQPKLEMHTVGLSWQQYHNTLI